jgi:DNA repair protein RadC
MSAVAIRRLADMRDAYQASLKQEFKDATVLSVEQAVEVLAPLVAPLRVESFVALPLNARSKLASVPVIVSRGDVDGTDAGVRAVLRAVLISEGTSFIVGHNHPSGEVDPSAQDIAVTRRMIEAGKAIDCPCSDHIIVGIDRATGRFRHTSLRRDHADLWR